MKEKVVFVTGAAAGIGKGLCESVLSHGGSVAFCDLNEKSVLAVRDDWSARYGAGRVWGGVCDVTDSSALEHAMRSAVQYFGGRLHAVVNNAGIGEIALIDASQRWRKVLDVDLTAVVDGTRLAILFMRQPRALYANGTAAAGGYGAAGGDGAVARSPAESVCDGDGVVVNVSSMAGLLPQAISPLYTAAKFGVLGFSRAMGGYHRPYGIRVNCVCPSFTDTAMVSSGAAAHKSMAAAVKALGVMDVSVVTNAMLALMCDRSRNAAAVRVTARNGAEYIDFRHDPAQRSAKPAVTSKL